jgi:hypothetical protein
MEELPWGRSRDAFHRCRGRGVRPSVIHRSAVFGATPTMRASLEISIPLPHTASRNSTFTREDAAWTQSAPKEKSQARGLAARTISPAWYGSCDAAS